MAMPYIKTTHEFDRRLRVLIVSGGVGAADIEQHLQARPLEPPIPTFWDFAFGSLNFDPDELGGLPIPRIAAPVHAGDQPRTALFCPNELDHGLLRILRVFAQTLHYPEQIRLFRNRRAARRWIGACAICLQQTQSPAVHPASCPQICSEPPLRASCRPPG